MRLVNKDRDSRVGSLLPDSLLRRYSFEYLLFFIFKNIDRWVFAYYDFILGSTTKVSPISDAATSILTPSQI